MQITERSTPNQYRLERFHTKSHTLRVQAQIDTACIPEAGILGDQFIVGTFDKQAVLHLACFGIELRFFDAAYGKTLVTDWIADT